MRASYVPEHEPRHTLPNFTRSLSKWFPIYKKKYLKARNVVFTCFKGDSATYSNTRVSMSSRLA